MYFFGVLVLFYFFNNVSFNLVNWLLVILLGVFIKRFWFFEFLGKGIIFLIDFCLVKSIINLFNLKVIL